LPLEPEMAISLARSIRAINRVTQALQENSEKGSFRTAILAVTVLAQEQPVSSRQLSRLTGFSRKFVADTCQEWLADGNIEYVAGRGWRSTPNGLQRGSQIMQDAVSGLSETEYKELLRAIGWSMVLRGV
jgi:biotin operon repressor